MSVLLGHSSSSPRDLAGNLRDRCSLCVAPPHHVGHDLLRAHRRHPPQHPTRLSTAVSLAARLSELYLCDVHAVSLVLTWPLRRRRRNPPRSCRRSHRRRSAEGPHVGALEPSSLQLRSRGHSLSGNVGGAALHTWPAGTRCQAGQVRGGERAGASPPCACYHW